MTSTTAQPPRRDAVGAAAVDGSLVLTTPEVQRLHADGTLVVVRPMRAFDPEAVDIAWNAAYGAFAQWADGPGGTSLPGRRVGGLLHCPLGLVGERRAIRETWHFANWTEEGFPVIGYRADGACLLFDRTPWEWGARLTDIWAELSAPENYGIDQRAADRRWRSSACMPLWVARTTVRIADVRAGRGDALPSLDGDEAGPQARHGAAWWWVITVTHEATRA